jgi:hypothetical protein
MEFIDRLTKLARSSRTLMARLQTDGRRAVLRASLRKLGLAPPFKPTPVAVKAYQLILAEKVALIDRLPPKYRKDVQQVVWDAVMKGYDAAGLAHELHERFGFVPERAQSIALIQCKMARAVMSNADGLQRGAKDAVWRHDERCALPDHKDCSGKRYRLARGANLDGKWVWPGSEPQCFCTSAEYA